MSRKEKGKPQIDMCALKVDDVNSKNAMPMCKVYETMNSAERQNQ